MEEKPMSYCNFIKCSSLFLMGAGCGFYGSGENCWTIYPHVWEGKTFEDFKAYDLYLEEYRLNESEPSCRTSRAREKVTKLIDRARELGLELIYVDTDSVIIKTPGGDAVGGQ